MKIILKIVIVAMFIASPQLSSAQYFQHLFDNDSSQDWGWSICQKTDNSYFVLGWSFNEHVDEFSMYNMTISNDGNTILSHNKQKPVGTEYNIGPGISGEILMLPGSNEYAIPLIIAWPDPTTHYSYCAGGLGKFTSLGDTIFLKTYTDTAKHFDVMYAIGITSDNEFILGGSRGTDTPSVPFALLIKTDSFGDTMWTRTYQKISTQDAYVNSVIPLSDGRILVGAMSSYIADGGPPHHITYNHNTPWFLLLDSMGNVLRDTLYGSEYSCGANSICGELYPDKNGGYINIGAFDSLYTPDPGDDQNLPGYIAHLDTNFRMTWVTSFPYSTETGHRQGVVAKQLRDSSYIVVGDSWGSGPYNKGFAAKINRSGGIVWSHNYYSDATHDAYLRDVVERPDGGFVMTGGTFNDTLPAWHQHQDMWLVGVDSNGCEDGLCAPAAVPAAPQQVVKSSLFSVYPNPTYGTLTITTTATGTFTLYTMLGQEVRKYELTLGKGDIQLPESLAVGIYMGKFAPTDGGDVREVRLVYQP